MPDLYPLSDEVKVNILRKLLFSWDGQWFLKTVDEFGLEAAIRLNARVRASFGRIEMRTLLRALGKRCADDLAEYLSFVRDTANFAASVNVLIDPEGLEVSVR